MSESMTEQEEIVAALESLDGEGQAVTPPEPEAPTPPEDAAPEADSSVETAKPEFPRTIRTKIAGAEVEVPLVMEDGSVNPQIIKALEKAGGADRRMEEAAEERRRVLAERAQIEQMRAEIEAAKAAAESQKLTEGLPEDDPYVRKMLALESRIASIDKMSREAHEAAQRVESDRLQREQMAALQAEEQRLKEAYKINDRELTWAEQEFMRRATNGEDFSLEDAVKEVTSYISAKVAAEKNAVLEEFKKNHKVPVTDKAPDSVPSGTPSAPPPTEDIRSEGFIQTIREALSR